MRAGKERIVSDINFRSEWVEKCVRRALNKESGELSGEEISKIRYVKAGGDFCGGIVLELSTEMPPEPFCAFDGGDEWVCSLHSERTLGEQMKLEDYICRRNGSIWLDHGNIEFWPYAASQEAGKNWAEFEKRIIKNNIFDDYTAEQLNDMGKRGENLLPEEDLKQFSGLRVFRLFEADIDSIAYFEAFPELQVLELAEVNFQNEEGGLEPFSKLRQITFWVD